LNANDLLSARSLTLEPDASISRQLKLNDGNKPSRPPLRGVRNQEALQRLADGAVQADLARSYGVSEATISRLAAASPFEHGAVGL
jgi:hypothetical protein